jgi:hypothetical protein
MSAFLRQRVMLSDLMHLTIVTAGAAGAVWGFALIGLWLWEPTRRPLTVLALLYLGAFLILLLALYIVVRVIRYAWTSSQTPP